MGCARWVALALLTGCGGTVDIGATLEGVNACRPSQEFFVAQVWPNFLAKDYGGKRCADSGCHDAAAGRALVLAAPTSAPTLPLAADWAATYRSVTQQLFCTNVGSSPLLARPDGRQTHGGGKMIEPDGPEAMLLKMWVASR